MRRSGDFRVGWLLILLVIFCLIGGFFWFAQEIFFGKKSENSSAKLNAGEKLLENPNNNLGARISVRGPIIAQEKHYSLAMTITQNSRNLTIWRGYDGEIFKQIQRTNSAKSFADFVGAIKRAGIATERKITDQGKGSKAGICASGQLIKFEILEKNSVKFSLWTTSCKSNPGNFGGEGENIKELFLRQIPNAQLEINRAKTELSK